MIWWRWHGAAATKEADVASGVATVDAVQGPRQQEESNCQRAKHDHRAQVLAQGHREEQGREDPPGADSSISISISISSSRYQQQHLTSYPKVGNQPHIQSLVQ